MKLLSAAIQCANSQTVRLIKILGLFFLTLFKVCYFLSVVLWSILSWSQSWVFVVQAFAYYYSGISRSTLIWMNGLQHLDVIPLKSPLPFDPGVTLWEYQCSWSQGCNQDRVKVKDKSKSEQFRDQVKTVVKGKKKQKTQRFTFNKQSREKTYLEWQSGPPPVSRCPPRSRNPGPGPVSSPPSEGREGPRPGEPPPGSCSGTLGWKTQEQDERGD